MFRSNHFPKRFTKPKTEELLGVNVSFVLFAWRLVITHIIIMCVICHHIRVIAWLVVFHIYAKMHI